VSTFSLSLSSSFYLFFAFYCLLSFLSFLYLYLCWWFDVVHRVGEFLKEQFYPKNPYLKKQLQNQKKSCLPLSPYPYSFLPSTKRKFQRKKKVPHLVLLLLLLSRVLYVVNPFLHEEIPLLFLQRECHLPLFLRLLLLFHLVLPLFLHQQELRFLFRLHPDVLRCLLSMPLLRSLHLPQQEEVRGDHLQ
jgi:hypothetical protein